MKKILLITVVAVATMMLNTSCNGCTNEKDNDTTVTPKPKELSTKVSVYIDNSSSMKGYFDSNNSAPMIGVLAGLTQFYNDVEINGYYMNVDTIVSCPWSKLTSNITKRKFTSYSDAMQIDALIEKIMGSYDSESPKNNVINFILTDGIPSGTNEEVRKDPNFNKNSASLLQVRIAQAIKSKGLAASVYKFSSGFDGIYYFFDNTNVKKSMKERPFYLIAIGKKDLVMELAEKENGGLSMFKAEEKVHFGAVEEDKIKLTSTSFDMGTMNIPEKAFGGDDDVVAININMQLSLSGLPYFARTQDYLNKHMELTIDGKSPKGCNVQGTQLNIPLKVEQMEEHSVKVKITNNTLSWVEESTLLDDKKASSDDLASKTFNLKYLVEGLCDGVTHSTGTITLFEKEFKVTTCAENNSDI